ncbi:MAG: type II toxin-antitoxin system HicA family toxin [Spirochaetales bacterium]|jgi:predicted RNA binding protein YcfA (HicA-like mRNA interferase family)|nr:type II toxin-antitoxin system HicA family toxin [Spirochaetales bacterium]
MKIPRNLSGRDLIKVLTAKFEYQIVHERGSHIILETDDPSHHRIAIPDHRALRVGTLNAILRAISNHRNITRNEILKFL